MNTLKFEVARFEKVEDLKPLLAAQGPCLSIYMPLSSDRVGDANEKERQVRWRDCIHDLKAKAAQFGAPGREIVDSVEHWDTIREALGDEETSARALALFRSDDAFQLALLDHQVPERAVMGPHFFIRPLLSELVRSRKFYLLALSQKNTRLLYCTMKSSGEVPFPEGVKTDFEAWMNTAKPDHNSLDNAMATGQQGSVRPTALGTKNTDEEKKSEYLSHFFKQLDGGVNEVLKGKPEPLVLCAVEYEIPLYREVNHYPHLAPEEVRGAPNSLKSGEMHARAIQALERCYEQKLEQTLADWNHRVGGGASSRLKEVVTASHEGRVLTLLISDSIEMTGVYDEVTHTVKARETGTAADEDIINEAAVQTILHAGKVLVVPHHKMPNGSAVAAIYRY